jgi:hypothetical protein
VQPLLHLLLLLLLHLLLVCLLLAEYGHLQCLPCCG